MMHLIDTRDNEAATVTEPLTDADALRPLLESRSTRSPQSGPQYGVLIGELVGMSDDGHTPLVMYSGQPGTAALAARSVLDVYGPHIGSPVVLMFEGGDAKRPIIMGVLRAREGWPLAEAPAQVHVEADGQRLLVTAKDQLVLKCGKASITLTAAGKVLIRGEYVSSWAVGVNRVKGGSVQLN